MGVVLYKMVSASAYFVGLALSISSMIAMKVAWKLFKRFSFKVMLKLDDVGGFAQQMNSRKRSSMVQIIPPPSPEEPKMYILCVVLHEKEK